MATSYRAAQTLIKRGDEAALRTALSSGLDANASNQNGWSLLMLAAVEGAVPLGQALLEKGAAVGAHNRNSETALSLAAQKGHVPFIQLLVQNGAPADCTPHGKPLIEWLKSSSGLSEEQLTDVLAAISPSASA